jgi:16S rRNA G527 N7-methylase RsmG
MSVECSKDWLEARLKEATLLSEVSASQLDRFNVFLNARATWSRTHNLSGPQALLHLSTDLIDGIATSMILDPSRPLIDVGTGSGVPGLIVACMEPNRGVHLVEPSAKRCAFLRTMIHTLSLTEVTVHRARWPHAPLALLRDAQVISRAVVSPKKWPHLARSIEPQEALPNYHIIQMLALARPPWPLDRYTLAQELEYIDPEGGARLLRRWVPSPPQ